MPDIVDIRTAEDLWRTLPKGCLRRRYVAKLWEAAAQGIIVGVLEEAVKAEALSDWEAAALIEEHPSEDITLPSIAEAREHLNRESPLVQEHGYRAGRGTYRLHPALTGLSNA